MLSLLTQLHSILFDFEGYRITSHATPHALRLTKNVVDVFASNLPETLERGICANAPYAFNGIWAMIRPWLAPSVQQKVKFTYDVDDFGELADKEFLSIKHGGTMQEDYPIIYWKPEYI